VLKFNLLCVNIGKLQETFNFKLMKRLKQTILFSSAISALLLISTCTSKTADQTEVHGNPSRLRISVDPCIELFSTIHRLAGTGQYNEHELPEYVADVENWFGPYRDQSNGQTQTIKSLIPLPS